MIWGKVASVYFCHPGKAAGPGTPQVIPVRFPVCESSGSWAWPVAQKCHTGYRGGPAKQHIFSSVPCKSCVQQSLFFLLCLGNLSATAGEGGRAELALGVSMKVCTQLGAASQAHEITYSQAQPARPSPSGRTQRSQQLLESRRGLCAHSAQSLAVGPTICM